MSQWSVTLPVWIALLIAVVNLLLVLRLLPETHPLDQRQPLPRKRALNPFTQLSGCSATPGEPAVFGLLPLLLGLQRLHAVLVLFFKQKFGWGLARPPRRF